ncbi:MAG TPA: zinc ribbon domain-containing protein [Pyrinomonadaceae bacterium]|nr:zinc ribbon domain-containing protein [Pyrinomonadaceae bacterium]
MFCPNCGQQQISDSTKYCPRCGTPLAGLAEWLAAGGGPLVVRDAPASPAPLSPRRKGMRRGAKLMFLSGVLLPFLIGLSIAAEHPGPLVIFFMLFFLGLSLMLYARLFGEDAPRVKGKQAQRQIHATNAEALPPAAANRVNNFAGRGARTAEIVQPPPSVTDHTTRLLDDE